MPTNKNAAIRYQALDKPYPGKNRRKLQKIFSCAG